MLEKEAKERQRVHGNTAPGRPSETLPAFLQEVKGESAELAGKLVGVGTRMVYKVAEIAREAPEQMEALVGISHEKGFRRQESVVWPPYLPGERVFFREGIL